MIELPLQTGLFATRYTYVLFAALLALGLYMIIASPNLVKQVIGLNLFQTAIFLFFISTGYLTGGQPPIIPGDATGSFVSPLPHVIILTAIVVGVAMTAVALALIVRIYRDYGSLNETVIREVTFDD